MVKPIPDGYHTMTPYLTVKGCDRAMAFYTKAFGAKELVRMPMRRRFASWRTSSTATAAAC
jgi:uncharacterized glyoxalase superfamily protein PhnB